MFKVNEHAKALALCFFICFAYNVFICGESPIHKGSGHRLVSYITIYIFYNKNGQFSFMFFILFSYDSRIFGINGFENGIKSDMG